MFFRFRGLMMLENQDPDLYEIKVKQIEIRWPSGIVQTVPDVAANQVLAVKEAAGK